MNRFLFACVLFAFLVSSTHAAYVKFVEPVTGTFQAGSSEIVDLGVVGPGQKVEVVVDADTGEISRQNQTISRKNANWNLLKVDAGSLPAGWRGENSGENEAPLKAYVIVSTQAPDGTYEFRLQAVDAGEGVPPLSFSARATVSRNVFNLALTSDPVKVRARETASYVLTLQNTGSANDVFGVQMLGVPGSQPREVQVLVPHNSKVQVTLPANVQEVGAYALTFSSRSLSSNEIKARTRTTLFVGSYLLTDARAAARGVLLFPSAEYAVYALWSVLGSVLG